VFASTLSSLVRSALLAGSPFSSFALSLFKTSTSNFASLSPCFAFFSVFSSLEATLSRSARESSILIVSMSRIGSIVPSTWVIFGSSKQRTT